MHAEFDRETKACIDACLACHRACEEHALAHCLPMGGDHVAPEHFGLMLNCADVCRTSAHFMMASSEFAQDLCELCAEICDACAQSCEELGDMKECVAACRACAEACRVMAGAAV